MSKEGSTISGLMDTIATSISLALQYGVPLRVLVDRFSHMRFEPSGFTGNPDIPIAKSIVDYIFRWLGLKFLKNEDSHVDTTLSAQAEKMLKKAIDAPQMALPIGSGPATPASKMADVAIEKEIFRSQADAPPCHVCGTITVRAGACYCCPNCGATSGCS
jgi:ribonucleoside-diphosphate reductase alpha chain